MFKKMNTSIRFIFVLSLIILSISIGRRNISALEDQKLQKPVKTHPVITVDDRDSIPIDWNFSYYEDKDGSLDIEKVINLDKEGKFKPASSELRSRGVISSTYWMKLIVKNVSSKPERYLRSISNLLKNFEVFQQERLKGTLIKNKRLKKCFPVARFSLEPTGITTLYVKNYGHDVVNFNLFIETTSGVDKYNTIITSIGGVITGCILIIIFYNFFLFLSLMDRTYFYYILYAIVNSYFVVLFFNFPEGINDVIYFDLPLTASFLRSLAPITTYLFARSFLRIKSNFPILDKIMKGFIYLLLLIMLMFLIFKEHLATINKLLDPIFLISLILLVIAGVKGLTIGFKPSKFYLFAMGFFITGMIIYLLAHQNILPLNNFTRTVYIQGHVIEMVLMSLALADRIKLLQSEKATAMVKANQADKLGHLLRIISHDLKNYLFIIRGNTQLLLNKDHSEKRLIDIEKSVGMIDDITLYISKMQSLEDGKVKLELVPVLIQDIFNDLEFIFTSQAEAKSILLKFHLEDDNLAVLAERTTLLNEVMSNLLSNAIKFSSEKQEINIKASRIENNVKISVSDNGIGIPSEIAERIFSPTEKTTRTGTAGEEGSGFGMPIVHRFVNEFGGEIEIKSASIDDDPVNHGTTVLIKLLQPKAFA